MAIWGLSGGTSSVPRRDETPARRTFSTDDPVKRGCALDRDIVARIWRGYVPEKSFDLAIVPQFPNYPGSFDYTGHSGPWDYLQRIPLVLYGPGNIERRGTVDRPAHITDVYPTAGRLLDVQLPEREAQLLHEAIAPQAEGAKVIVTVVWDGVGRNVLERWPDAWPNLAELEVNGTSYANATLGSAPSITPSTHSSLGTGAFPRSNGIPAIEFRNEEGLVTGTFGDRNPSDLKLTTFGDEIDRALGNAPKVGMLAWKSWHLGMLGHGTQLEGGDADQLGLFGFSDGDITGNDAFYSTPSYLRGFTGLERHADELDREDGAVDGRWMGHPTVEIHDNPAWIYWQSDAVLAMLEREGYGADAVPDLFFTNYKVADIVGHEYSMESQEMEAVVRAQDDALGRLVAYLEQEVEDYVVVVTADHGHTPPSSASGGWPVKVDELVKDIDAHFDVAKGNSLTEKATAAGFFMDRQMMRNLGVTATEIAEFANGYTIKENWPEDELPEGFTDRGHENVLSAAFTGGHLPDIMRCTFGERGRPPEDVG